MSLIFFKNNKPDNRMIEYDQAVVRLGLKKAAAQAELDRSCSEIAKVGLRHATLLNNIKDAEKKLQTKQREVADAVRIGTKQIAGISRERQKAEEAFNKKTRELGQLEKQLASLQAKIIAENATLNIVDRKIKERRESLRVANQELVQTNTDKLNVEKDIISLRKIKKEMGENISASEEKLDYLSKKEQSLNRKEADLIKYEKRVEKLREDAGDRNKMIFK